MADNFSNLLDTDKSYILNNCDIQWYLRIPSSWVKNNKFIIDKTLNSYLTVVVTSTNGNKDKLDIFITTDVNVFAKGQRVLAINVSFANAVRVADEYVAKLCENQKSSCNIL